ncbi:GGDEF domain-containing protein [Robertmurraya korlensis]|uniref:GGDEF domain-containing protein n=1 Tax=Robertmurraya korlensis TaxID=519977 RepID=UPI001E4B1609|nr:GGDEF domain-containing protein [Robertmurraya korlensis]
MEMLFIEGIVAMHDIIDIFISNMALIISFMYITLKLKEVYISKYKNVKIVLWILPLFISLLSVWVMHHPLLIDGMRIDLRGVPLFFISTLMGWKWGILSILLPIWYRYDLGGPTVIQGITQAIIAPYVIGALFHRKKHFNPPYTVLTFKNMFTGFIFYELIKSFLMFWTTPANLTNIILMITFEAIALSVITLINNDVNANLLTRKELEFHSTHDNMTSLYNLRYFKNKVNAYLKKEHPFVIAMFDVDYFKVYNDNHGHPAGDIVLRTIGQLLKDSMRRDDVFARYGGEEFIICFSNVSDRKTAFTIADRFRNLVETYPFPGEEQQPNGVLTISMGLSTVSTKKDLDTLIEEADKALYKAKNDGRNNVQSYEH